MSWNLDLYAAVRDDLDHASRWYEDRKADLGVEFLLSVADTFSALMDRPESFPIYSKDFRRALVRQFPYKVFFRIGNNTVIVYRLLHTAQSHERQLDDIEV